ncbi:MAG: DUF4058 family protein [Caldilinea sp. CFX5]|nr:DUF4058 family protein [Caldilinea sp. CFX5]
MPLLDHFHPPLKDEVGWHSFHHAWCTYIAGVLNRILPDHYRATPHVQYGIEVDVAALEVRTPTKSPKSLREVATVPYTTLSTAPTNGHTEPPSWRPPPPTQLLPFSLLTESVEVLIHNSMTIPTLVGAVELVSEANKDRPAERAAFVTKCESYLRQGVGLVIVDVVTSRRANLHQELLNRLGQAPSTEKQPPLYTTAYRPFQQDEAISLAIWQEALTLDEPLPTMPLWLRREFCAPLNLEATYVETCQSLRIPMDRTEAANRKE